MNRRSIIEHQQKMAKGAALFTGFLFGMSFSIIAVIIFTLFIYHIG